MCALFFGNQNSEFNVQMAILRGSVLYIHCLYKAVRISIYAPISFTISLIHFHFANLFCIGKVNPQNFVKDKKERERDVKKF